MNRNSDSGAEAPDNFPGLTEWVNVRMCGLPILYYIPSAGSYYIGHYEISSPIPLIFLVLSSYTYLFNTIILMPLLMKLGLQTLLPFSLVFFLFLYTFCRVIIDGPGYLPFYYPFSPSNIPPAPPYVTLNPSGITSLRAQKRWASNRPQPQMCAFCRSAGRIVIRPYCYSVTSSEWIGKRNLKFEILFDFYGVIYSIASILLCSYGIAVSYRNGSIPIAANSSLIWIMSTFWATKSFIGLLREMTDSLHNRSPYMADNNGASILTNRGCIGNLEEVFGPKTWLLMWLFPISPWSSYSDEELVQNYDENSLKPDED